MNVMQEFVREPVRPLFTQPAPTSARLNMLSDHELEDLRHKIERGQVPSDFEAKLINLARGNLAHRSIEQNCRTMIALLQAAHQGAFKEPTPTDCKQLLRVIAYVRKDDDAIPDYRPDGFTDDQQAMRAVAGNLSPLLQTFKAWRLRHQVPAMWSANSERTSAQFSS
jgi:hypothetical protein